MWEPSPRVTPSMTVLLFALLAGPCLGATYHVSQGAAGASDGNPGTAEAPLKFIGAAMRLAQPGDTVLVGEGTYREEVVWEGEDWKDPARRMVLAAAPGARPVIKGSDVVPGPWEEAEVELTAPPATPAAIYSCAWEPYSQMVFVDGEPLQQIGLQGSPARAKSTNGFQYKHQWEGKTVEDLRPGSFFCDGEGKRLYVWLADGSDPSDHVVEASVREDAISVRGTWTLRGLDVRHFQDGFWPHEQAVGVRGAGCIIEDCRITHNEFLGLIVSGEDCIVRNNELAYNGLEGMTSNYGFRMLVEGNEFHHNAWRGDVVCLTYGNKFVMWRDTRFLRNHWHDEPAAALWLDISNANILVAENTFENCSCGVYFEISRWGVIANNIFRGCGRAVWVYGADVLVAHNVFDGCGEGVTITGHPRTATYAQVINEDVSRDCLMAVRNVQVVNNILIDCVGAFVGITESCPYGWGNWSDYNAFVWTLKPYHRTGIHLNFMGSWDQLYSKLPIWRLKRHCDTHSVVVDPGQLEELRLRNPYVGLAESEVFADAGFRDLAAGDYGLAPDSPLVGKGLALPMVLNSQCLPCEGNKVLTRAFAMTRLADAPDPAAAVPVYGTGEKGHYRLQPLPKLHALVDLDSCEPGTPGLNPQWRETGEYPRFRTDGEADTAEPTDWMVLPDNLLADPSFDRPLGKPGEAEAGPWVGGGGMHVYQGMLAANLGSAQRQNVLAYQKVGAVRAGAEYLLCGDMSVSSRSADFAGIAGMYLAAGDPAKPMGDVVTRRAEPMRGGSWGTYDLYHHTGAQGADVAVGQDLYVVVFARVEGPEGGGGGDPVAFARWDDLWLLSGPPEAAK